MSDYQKEKDIFIQRRTATGTFEEYPLIVQPSNVLVTDAANNLVMVDGTSFISSSGFISASYSLQSLSASYAPGSPSISASFAESSSLAITSSFSINSSMSFAINFIPEIAISASWVSASVRIINADTASFVSNTISASHSVSASYALTQTVQVSSSWASSSISASYVPNLYPQIIQESASWASASISASLAINAFTASFVAAASIYGLIDTSSYALTAQTLLGSIQSASYAGTASILLGSIQSASFASTSSYALNGSGGPTLSASWASSSISASHALTADVIGFVPTNAVSASWVSASVTIDTASYSTNSEIAYSVNFVPIYAISASWISASIKVTTADTASYVSSLVIGTPSSATSASFASASQVAYSINFVPNTSISASWVSASNLITTAQTASYISSSAIFDSNIYNNTSSRAITSSFALIASDLNFVPSVVISASWASQSLSSSWAPVPSASQIPMLTLQNSKFNNVQELQDIFHSAGWCSGGAITTGSVSGSFLVSAGDGLIRAINNSTASVYWFSWNSASFTASNNPNTEIFIYATYNGGNTIVSTSSIDPSLTNYQTNVLLGKLYYVSSSTNQEIHINSTIKETIGDHAKLMINFNKLIMPYAHENGGFISASGLTINITAGAFWEGLTRFTTDAFDSSVSSSFSYYYRSASVWTENKNSQSIDNTKYNDVNVGLVSLGTNKVKVDYVFLSVDNDVHVVYGENEYNNLASSLADSVPSILPEELSVDGFLIGRVISKQGVSSILEADSVFQVMFQMSPTPPDHNSLSGLQGGTSGQYYHLTSEEYVGTGTGIFVRQNGGALSGSLQGTSSWAINSTTSSYATNANMAYSINFVPNTSLTSTQSLFSTQSLNTTNSIYSISASWVSASAKITTSDTASYVLASNIANSYSASVSSQIIEKQDTLTNTLYVITASLATSASYSPVEPAYSSSVSTIKQNTLIVGNTYIITSSWSNNSLISDAISFVPNTSLTATQSLFATQSIYSSSSLVSISSSWASSSVSSSYSTNANIAYSINFVPITTISASWVSSSVQITTADTASYITASNVAGAIISSSYALSSSYAPGGNGITDGGSYNISASWASSSLSSSYSTGSVIGTGINAIVSITYANYVLLNPPDATTLYVVIS